MLRCLACWLNGGCTQGKGPAREISFQLTGVRTGELLVYGRGQNQRGHTLRDAFFLLDPQIVVTAEGEGELGFAGGKRVSSYEPTVRRFQLQELNYSVVKDFVRIHAVPPGNHVLTVMTDTTNPRAAAAVTHIVVF